MTPSVHASRGARAALAAAAVAVALALLAAPSHAQGLRVYLPAGKRVRVVSVPDTPPFTGNVLRLTSDTLTLAASSGSALVQLPVASLTSIEESEGRDRMGWAFRGAGIGVIVGGIGGGLAGRSQDDFGLGAIAGFIAGGIVGTVGGAVVGAIVAPERWRRVSFTSAGP